MKNQDKFFCYSFKLAYFIKSQGLDYYVFQKSDRLDEIIQQWNKLKSKED